MARAWVRDLWTKDHVVTIDGQKVRVPPSGKVETIAPQFRTSRWMKGNRWAVEWLDDDGRKHTATFAKRAPADAEADRLDKQLRAGMHGSEDRSKELFSVVADKWLNSRRKAGPSTLLQYEGDLRKYVLPRWGKTQLRQVRSEDIDAWVTALETGKAPASLGKGKTPGPLAPATVRRLVSVVFGGVIRWAVRNRYLTVNPLDPIELAAARPQKPEAWLSVPEIEALADAAGRVDGERSRILVRTLAYSGLRIGEALALHVEDFDASSGLLHVRRTWTVTKTGRVERDGTKTGAGSGKIKTRTVPLPPELVSDLMALVEGEDSSAYMFRAARGAPMDDHNWRSRVWNRAVQGAGLDGVEGLVIHSLRHSFASLAIAGGIDVVTLARVMGHEKASITLDVYSHFFPDQIGQVATVISGAIEAGS